MSVSIQTILFPPKKKPSAAPSKQRSIRVSSKIKCAPPKPPPIVDPLDQKRLESILNSISIQGDELLLGEEMWRKRAQEKRLTDNCLTSVGRSKSVATTFPTIQQAKEWSFEKEFWLSYIPCQQRIWEYSQGDKSWEYWGPVKRRPSEDKFLEELQTDPRTGAKISLAQRCRRHERQVTWEQKVISEYDGRVLAKFPVIGPKRSVNKSHRDKGIAQAQTLNRFSSYRKALINNLMDVQIDTRLLDEVRVRGFSRRFQVEQMERLIEGYTNLKWVYDLNPELVESLAQQHLRGPGGKQWMNLSRVEVKKVLKLLANSSQDPNFCPYTYLGSQSEARVMSSRSAGVSSAVPVGGTLQGSEWTKNAGSSNNSTKVKNKKSGIRALKPSQLMPLHVPGPDSLHQNVLIRPYTPEMDGQQGNAGISISKTQVGATAVKDNKGAQEEEGLTIESFAPFYKS